MGCSSSAGVSSRAGAAPYKCFHNEYLIGAKLGSGSFAQIYAVTPVAGERQHDEATNVMESKCKAVKIILINGERRIRKEKKAHNEACIWRSLGYHPNCLMLHDVFYSVNFCYMVCQRCGGVLLQYVVNMPEVNERTLGPVFAQMLRGMEHVHSNRVIHRDIKPDNFLVGGAEGHTIKLCDFGLSVLMMKTETKLTGVSGTAPFMCPEMLLDRGYDCKADVWSFGVLMYVMLFGDWPYKPVGEANSDGMKEAIIYGRTPLRFRPKSRQCTSAEARSDTIIDLVKSMLIRDPEQRMSTKDALKASYMVDIAEERHLVEVKPPSLRPALHSAMKIGAFETRDVLAATEVDELLNNLQSSKHGVGLPPIKQFGGSVKDVTKDQKIVPANAKHNAVVVRRSTGSACPNGWEDVSSRSTACGGSDADVESLTSLDDQELKRYGLLHQAKTEN